MVQKMLIDTGADFSLLAEDLVPEDTKMFGLKVLESSCNFMTQPRYL